MKRIPDILTTLRGVIAIIIALLGFYGQQALELVILLIMVGWTTDIFDGRLARRYETETTWIGKHEFSFDMAMVFAVLCYTVLAGYVPVLPAVIYVVVAATAIAYWQSKTVTMSFACPIVVLPLVLAYFDAPRIALLFAVWTVLALLVDWQRFKGIVLDFIDGARSLAKR